MKTEIVTVVWGQPYITPFMELVLPSLLAKGNFPAWPWLDDTSLHIWTTPEDATQIQRFPVWSTMSSLLKCAIHFLPEQATPNKYMRMNQAHQEAFAHAQDSNAAALMLMPDTVFCDGALQALAELLATGLHDVIFCHSPRVDSHTAVPHLQSKLQNQILTVSSQQAVKLLLEHCHPITYGQFWDSNSFDPDSNHVYYWQPTGQLAVRAFHLHPLIYTHFYQPFDPAVSTFDGAFVQQYGQYRERVGVVQDQRILLLSLTAPEDSESVLHGPQPLFRRQLCLDRFRRQGLHPLHHWLFEQLILLTPPPELAGEVRPDINDAVESLQLFWQLESHVQTGEHRAAQALLANKKWVTHLPMVLRQAALGYVLTGL